MRTLGRFAYWLVALAIVSIILVSLDYSPFQALLIGLVFCPCALALEFLMPKARNVIDKIYLSLAVLAAVILLILCLHYFVWSQFTPDGTFRQECDTVVNGIGFVPAPIGEKGAHIHRVGDCVAVGNLRTVVWRAWDVCMRI